MYTEITHTGPGVPYYAHTNISRSFVETESHSFTMWMYADDTTLYCNVNNDVTDDLLNYELSKICAWLGANKLALNVSKTKFMVFHTINKHVIYPKLEINGNNIEQVTNFNFFRAHFKFYFIVELAH